VRTDLRKPIPGARDAGNDESHAKVYSWLNDRAGGHFAADKKTDETAGADFIRTV
jgi:hypothetical protein